jgi:hypothetical protein
MVKRLKGRIASLEKELKDVKTNPGKRNDSTEKKEDGKMN